MSANKELIRIFEQMAAGAELLGENPFKANAHARAARAIRDLPRDVADMVNEDRDTAAKRLAEIDGIGKGMAQRIVEYVTTGRIAEHEEMRRRVPSGLFKVLDIPGLGPKTVKLMWEKLDIRSIADLKEQLDSTALAELPRMGKKAIENIRQAIAFSETTAERTPMGVALPIAETLVEALRGVPGVKRVEYAGSLRRGRESVGDIDILIACDDEEGARDCFCSGASVKQVLARGDTKCSIRIEVDGVGMQADLRIVPEDRYGAGLMYFTGSKETNVQLRELAIRRNMRLNEYGLFEGKDERPQERGVEPVAARTEEEIFAALGLEWLPPELREERWRLGDPIPKLIELTDVKAELHSHTTASDGRCSIDEMVGFSQARGYHTHAVTDHSKSSVIANGLDEDRLREHVKLIRAVRSRFKGITILAGAEVDILPGGELDYDDDVLAELDIVVASPHVSLRQDPKTATKRLLKAITNPHVNILGHATGRIVCGREGLAPEMNEIFAAAREHDVALEINANWKRLDLCDTHVRQGLEAGCLFAIDTDAHRESHYDFLRYGVLTARRAGMEAASCINTWPANKLSAWLKKKH